MSIENEQSDDPYNKVLREKLEKKYNLNLNISDNEGQKTYEDLIKYCFNIKSINFLFF